MSKAFGAATLARAAVLLTGSTYVAYAAGLVASTIVARVLGPQDYGRYAYVLWLTSVLVTLMNNGLTTSSIRFISEFLGRGEDWATTVLTRRLMIWQVAACALVGGGLLVGLPWLEPKGWTSHLALFAIVTLLASWGKAAYLFRVSISKGFGQFNMEAMSVSLVAILSLLGAAILGALGAGLEPMLYLFAALNLSQLPMLWWMLRRKRISMPEVKPGQRIDSETFARVRKHLLWTIALTLVAAFSNKSIETFLLNRHAGAEVVGFFAVAAALTRGGVDLLSSGLNSILMPMMAHGFGSGGSKRVGEITSDAVRLFHFLGMLLAGVGVLWAQPVVLLMYGNQYMTAAFVLQIMVLVGGFTLSNSALGALLSTTDNQRMRTTVMVTSIVLSGATAIALVPTWGLNGALVSHAVATIVVMIFTSLIIQRSLGHRLPWSALMRLTLAGLLALGLVAAPLWWWDTPWLRWAGGALFVPLYLLLTVHLRVWQAKDLQLLGRLEGRFPQIASVIAYVGRWST